VKNRFVAQSANLEKNVPTLRNGLRLSAIGHLVLPADKANLEGISRIPLTLPIPIVESGDTDRVFDGFSQTHPAGLFEGEIEMSDEVFDPLLDDLVEWFNGVTRQQ
jgi:hypothetical protein